MLKAFIKKYQKAFFCTLIFANCNYWLYESMTVIEYVDTGKPQEAIQTDRDTLIVSYLFPNTLILLPMLGGILIDYMGPITALKYLVFILFIGSVILIKAVYTFSVWMVVLSALFFGFSLEIINMATYIYLANTFITRDFSIEFFQKGVSIYLILGIPISSLAYFINNTYFTAYMGIGLIVLSFYLTRILRVNAQAARMSDKSTNNTQLRISLDSLEYDPSKSVFLERFPDGDTFAEHNEKFETYELKGLWAYLKDIPANKMVGIIAMGLWEGIFIFYYRVAGFGVTYIGDRYFWFESLGCIIGSVVIFYIKWDLPKLNKFIFAGMLINAVAMIIAGLTPKDVDMYMIILMTLTNYVTNGAILLALPHYMNFNVDSFGKGYGFFRWLCCFAQFITSNFKTNDMAFSNQPFVLGFFLPSLICFMIFTLSLFMRGKHSLKGKVNFESSIEI
jgi:hypothetical protein